MSDEPLETSRRSRREARGTAESQTPQDLFGLGVESPVTERNVESGAVSGEQGRPDVSGRSNEPATAPVGVAGTGKPLVAAAGALVIAVGVGLIASVAFDGAAGRSVGGVVASLLLGATACALVSRVRPPGFLSVRAIDVLWALVLGAVLPFLTGVFGGALGFPALAALSPRWLLLGVAAPFVVVVGLTLFAVGLVFPSIEGVALRALPPVPARVLAALGSAVVFVVASVAFPATVSGMPLALPIGFGAAASVFVALSRRLWGPLLMGVVFTGVWVAMAVAGYVLA